MIILSIDDNSQQVNTYLKGLGRKMSNLVIPMKQIGMLMQRSVDDNFRQEGRPAKWKALAPSTVKQRRKGSSTILQDTGTLKNSINYEVRGTKEVAIGTSVAYAATHNFGRVQGKAVIPQRKFLLFQEEDKRRISKVLTDYIGKALTGKMVKF